MVLKKKINSFLEYGAKKNLIFIEKIKNKIFYKNKKISKIEYELKKQYLTSIMPYSSVEFYQSYPPLKIKGARPTLSRFLIYGIEKYLNKKKSILDIGGNTGFFSIFVSNKVKNIDILEIEPNFVSICKKLIKHEKVNNVKVINLDFNKFNPAKKYDIIFSFAVHGHTKMNFKDYINKLLSFLNKYGFILIESHPIIYGNNDVLEKDLKNIKNIVIFNKGLIDDDGRLRSFFMLRKNE